MVNLTSGCTWSKQSPYKAQRMRTTVAQLCPSELVKTRLRHKRSPNGSPLVSKRRGYELRIKLILLVDLAHLMRIYLYRKEGKHLWKKAV